MDGIKLGAACSRRDASNDPQAPVVFGDAGGLEGGFRERLQSRPRVGRGFRPGIGDQDRGQRSYEQDPCRRGLNAAAVWLS
jgi:hypothetical protein